MASWFAAFMLSVTTWLAFFTPSWQAGILALASFAAAVWALRSAMLRHGRRASFVAVAKRLTILLILVPNLLLSLAFVFGNDDAELDSGLWWLDMAHLGLGWFYLALPARLVGSFVSIGVVSQRAEFALAMLAAGVAYLVAGGLTLCLAAAIAQRLAPSSRSPATPPSADGSTERSGR